MTFLRNLKILFLLSKSKPCFSIAEQFNTQSQGFMGEMRKKDVMTNVTLDFFSKKMVDISSVLYSIIPERIVFQVKIKTTAAV